MATTPHASTPSNVIPFPLKPSAPAALSFEPFNVECSVKDERWRQVLVAGRIASRVLAFDAPTLIAKVGQAKEEFAVAAEHLGDAFKLALAVLSMIQQAHDRLDAVLSLPDAPRPLSA